MTEKRISSQSTPNESADINMHFSSYLSGQRLHEHKFYELEITLSGNGTQTINGIKYAMRRGEVHIIRPGDVHMFQTNSHIKTFLIQFPQKYIPKDIFFELHILERELITYLRDEECDAFENICNALNVLKDSDISSDSDMIRKLLDVLFGIFTISINDSSGTSRHAHDSQGKVQDIVNWLQIHYRTSVTVDEVAKQFHFNTVYLRRIFKEYTGESIMQYMKSLRLEYAHNLLLTTNARIADICDSSGYRSMSTFINDFKQKYHYTPLTFRAMFSGNSDKQISNDSEDTNAFATDHVGKILIRELGEKEKEIIEWIGFSDRILGFFEASEGVSISIKYKQKREGDQAYRIVLTDPYGRAAAEKQFRAVRGAETVSVELGIFQLGWYKIHIMLSESDDDLNDYLAFAVMPNVSERIDLSGNICADAAAEHDGNILEVSGEFVHSLKLMGFSFVRGRRELRQWGDDTKNYRSLLKENGIMITAITMHNQEEIPNFGSVDLCETYKEIKAAASDPNALADMIEIHNNSDVCFDLPSLPDTLTAYTKAISIALSDTDAKPYVAMTSNLRCNDGMYYDIQLQNGILDYSSIYNFHGYGNTERSAVYAEKSALAYSPSNSIRPVYMTENGQRDLVGSDGAVSDEQSLLTCRYAIKNAIKMISLGIDKWFWFVARAYVEGRDNLGIMHAWTQHPYPTASVFSMLTYHLGQCRYLGMMCELPVGVSGYVFDRGESDTAVIFSDGEEVEYPFLIGGFSAFNMFGEELVLRANKEKRLVLPISQDPIYIRFNGRAPDSIYYHKKEHCDRPLERITFSRAQRVILNPIWTDQDLTEPVLMQTGYLIRHGERQNVTLRIFNLSETKVEGDVFIETEHDEHFMIDISDTHFSIPPMSKAEISISLMPSKNVTGSGDILFGAVLDNGEQASGAVCRYLFELSNANAIEATIVKFKDYTSSRHWNLKNCSGEYLSMVSNLKYEEIAIKASHGDLTPTWFFPEYTVQNPEIFAGSNGIIFRRAHQYSASVYLSVFVVTSDGSEYWSGNGFAGVPFSSGWKTVIFPWNVFVSFSSSGKSSAKHLDPEQIRVVRIGVSETKKAKLPDIIIRDFGIYRSSRDIASPHPGEIVISGVEDSRIYETADGLKLHATLPRTVVGDIRVMNGRTNFPYEITEDGICADLSSLGRGEYIFRVSGRTKTNYRYSSQVTFYINE